MAWNTSLFVVRFRALERPIIRRFQEYQGRPKAIEDFQKAMFAGRAWFVEASKNMTEALAAGNLTRWTKEELAAVESMLKDHETWAKEKMEAQKQVGEEMHVDPVLLNSDLESRGKALQSHVSCLGGTTEKNTDPYASLVTGTWPAEEAHAEATEGQSIVYVYIACNAADEC